MSDNILSLILWDLVLLLLLAVGAALNRQRFRPVWALMALVLFNINVAVVLDFFGLNIWIKETILPPDLSFNWAGKLLALLLSLLILATGPIRWAEAGITYRQNPKAFIGWSVLLVLAAVMILVGLNLPDEPQTSETIAYQLTMPSLEEEVFYRGLFLACLTRALGEGPTVLWSRFGSAALISVIIFTLIHAFNWSEGGPQFSLENFLFAGLFGFVLTWMRLNTGSVVAPILAHSTVNALWRLVQLV